jgi:hypothetical protein
MVTGEQVIAWICFALSRATRAEAFRRWSTTPRGLPDLIVAALVHEPAMGGGQLLTYAHGYRRTGEVPRALLVHPAALGNSHRSITVRAPYGRPSVIDVVGLDVRQPLTRGSPNWPRHSPSHLPHTQRGADTAPATTDRVGLCGVRWHWSE